MNPVLKFLRRGLAFLLLALAGLNGLRADTYDTIRTNLTNILTGANLYVAGDLSTNPGLAGKISAMDLAISSTPTAAPNSSGTGLWDVMDRDPGRTFLWADLPLASDANLAASYFRLNVMAVELHTVGSQFFNNAALKADIASGLDYLYTNNYNESLSLPYPIANPNWYYWQIQIPQLLGKTTAIMYSDLTTTEITNYMNAVRHFLPSAYAQSVHGAPIMTASNLMDQIYALVMRAAVIKNSTDLDVTNTSGAAYAMVVGGGVLAYRSSGGSYDTYNRDGSYEDGSFIQHSGVPYINGYGQALLSDVSVVSAILSGTSYALSDANTYSNFSNSFKWFFDAMQPGIYRDELLEAFSGRNVAVGPALGPKLSYPPYSIASNHAGPMSTLAYYTLYAPTSTLGSGYPSNTLQGIESYIKYYLSIDTNGQILNAAPIYPYLKLSAIAADGTVPTAGELLGYQQFTNEDRALLGADAFEFVVSMNSKRTVPFECGSTTNQHGWYTGDGMLYLYNNDDTRYVNFWQTVNPYRMPGTTIDTQTRTNAPSFLSPVSPKTWVGGADLDGTYGVSGMDYAPAGDFTANPSTGALEILVPTNLTAKKSWFFFDNEMVALGAGISATDQTGSGWDSAARRTETVIDNAKLDAAGDNALTVNGTAEPTSPGWSASLSAVNWMQLQGSPAGDAASVGYYFPTATTVQALREARTGDYSQVNGGYASSLTIFPAADSYVQSGHPTWNFGTDTGMVVLNYTNARESYIKFDVSNYVQDNHSTFTHAVVNLEVTAFGGTTNSVTHQADVLVDNSWTETGLTWSDRPTSASSTAGTWHPTATTTLVQIDITSALQSIVAAGGRVISLRIYATSGTDVNSGVTYGTRENGTFADRPFLSITGYKEPTTSNFATFTINHGTNPTNATYAYVELPGASASAAAAYAAAPQVTVLQNDTNIQAVKETNLNVVGANFWQSSSQTLSIGGTPFLTADTQASIMTWEQTSSIEAVVSDPTQANTGTIHVQINRSATGVASSDASIAVTQLTPTIQFTVTPNPDSYSAGASRHVKFNLATSPTVLAPSDDSYVYGGAPTANYGTSATLGVKSDGSGDSRNTLYQFDVTSYTGTVSHAALTIYTTYIPSSGLQDEAFPITSAWTEGTVTWNTQPTIGTTALASWTVPSPGTATTIDVTSLVQAAVSGSNKKVGIEIQAISTGSSTNHYYGSKEDTSAYQPFLTITP